MSGSPSTSVSLSASLNLLLVEADDKHAENFEGMLRRSMPACVVERVTTLESAIERARDNDVILLELGLPDSPAEGTLRRFLDACPESAVLAMTTFDDHRSGLRAIHEGAQDYLAKNRVDEFILERAVRYAFERKRVEIKLHATTRELELRCQELEIFSRAVAHEMRSPLQTLQLLMELIEPKLDTDEKRSLVSRAQNVVEGMAEFVTKLLEFAAMPTELSLRPHRFSQLLEEAREGLAAELEECGGKVEVCSEDDPRVNVEPALMRQVLSNVIGNSVCYRSDEPVRIVVEAQRPNMGTVEVTVSDNGIGIDADQATELLGLFRRGRRSQTRSGYGIGLAYCKRIIEAHGGTFRIEPGEGGVGTRVVFTLLPAPEIG